MPMPNTLSKRRLIDQQLREFPTYCPNSFWLLDRGATWVYTGVVMYPESNEPWLLNPKVRLNDVRVEAYSDQGFVTLSGEGFARSWGSVPHPDVMRGGRPYLRDPVPLREALLTEDWFSAFQILQEFLETCKSAEGLEDFYLLIASKGLVIDERGRLIDPDGEEVIIRDEGTIIYAETQNGHPRYYCSSE